MSSYLSVCIGIMQKKKFKIYVNCVDTTDVSQQTQKNLFLKYQMSELFVNYFVIMLK